MTQQRVPMRSLVDRIRQIALFEVIGLLLITPLFAWATTQPLWPSLGLMVLLAAIASVWNGLFGWSFDSIEIRLVGRKADIRPPLWRALHALLFELGLTILTLPVLMFYTGMGLWPALTADIGLAITYTCYAYVFNWAYDQLFPIRD